MRKGQWWQVITPPLAEEMLFRWLAEQFSFPEKIWRKLNASGGIQYARNRLSLRLFPAESLNNQAGWTVLDIVYEDDFVIVIHKPTGVKVHPTEASDHDTLVQQLAGYYIQSGQELAVRVVHRLDRDTSGLILFAKGEFGQYKLDEAMRAKRIERVYQAHVSGRLKQTQGTIDAAIARDRHYDRYRVTTKGGLAARTHYKVLDWNPSLNISMLELHLETGRTHQIRVHLSSLGHPLIGDTLYGGQTSRTQRQALHATKLTFPHPWSGELITCEAPIPLDMKKLF